MSSRNLVLFTSLVLSCFSSFACSSDKESPGGTGGTPGTGGGSNGGGGSGNEDTCAVTVDTAAAPVSFKTDVMPIFGFACGGGVCHSGTRPKAGIFLGPKCAFDPATRTCTYPTGADSGDDDIPQPLTAAHIEQVWNGLRAASATAPAVKRVEPGDPDASFLVDKLAGIHNDKGLTCTNTETNASVGPCGQYMPYIGGPLCKTGSTGQTRLNTVVNWIAQGAPNN